MRKKRHVAKIRYESPKEEKTHKIDSTVSLSLCINKNREKHRDLYNYPRFFFVHQKIISTDNINLITKALASRASNGAKALF